jgi:structural maintenance of chromosome 4
VNFQDDDDKFDVVPNSQFVLSRTAHKSGASNYYLNERKINWTEATELLMGKGIDLEHNRFLILQGEVEQISLMKPKAPSPNEDGLLEYLEDIIGSHRFVSAIEEASKAVDTLNEQRQEKLNRVKLVEKDKDNLEGAKAEAEEFLARERDLNLRRVQLYQIFKYTEDKSCLELTKKAESARTKSAAAQTALVEHEATLAQSEAAYNAGTAEHAKVVNTMKQCKEDFAKIERRDVKNREELKNEKAKEKKAQATVVSTKAKITELEAAAAASEASIPDLQRRAAALNEQKVAEEATLESMFEKLKTTTGELRASMEAQQKKLVPLRKAVNAAQSKVEIAEGEITMFEERGNNARTQARIL